MMFQESADTRQSLHHMVLIAALTVFVQDLSSGGGAQAWTYNYSTSPNRRWSDARQWCQLHFTDLVPIRNQEENDFINNQLPFNPRYYWIGVVKKDGEWIWNGGKDVKVPEEAQNWAPNEPDNIMAQDCVEIYIKRDKDTAKWNNESCRKKKGTICYSASCTQDSCSANADCVETIGGYSCQCHPGFLGSRCEEVKKCSPLFFPVTGNVTCMDALEPFSFGSQCNFTCQEGYYLTRDETFTCLASGQWSNPTPTCTVVQCNSLQAPAHAAMQCQDPVGVYSYGSICTVQCEEGFDLIGTNMMKCSSQGYWSHELPVCQAKRCNPVNPSHGSLSCSDPNGPFSFGSVCTTSCEEGFVLNGTGITECTSLGMWSADIRCLAKRCPTVNSSSHSSLVCSGPHEEFSFGSRCTSTCEEGFVLNGTADTECTSLGTWSRDIPQCLAKRCPTLSSSSHGSFVCSDPHEEFSFGSRCTSTCEEGFVLNGTADTECTSQGTWSADIPRCLAKRCPAVNSSSHGSLVCSGPHEEFSFGSRCTSTCEEGFVLNGTTDTECTSLGTWSTNIPRCLAKRCPTLSSPSNGSLVCSDPHEEFSFGSRCTSTCEEGFVLNGTADTECTSLGMWSRDIPCCLAKRCPTLSSSSHGSLVCSDPHEEFSFGSRCTSTCEEGFVLNGTADTECTSLGTWSRDLPLCLAKRCPTLRSPSHSSLVCSDPHEEFSFGSRCTSTCEEGFVLNGTADTECTSLGMWSTDIPRCLAKTCPTLNSSSHGSLVCSDPHEEFSFGSRCTSSCEEGFVLNGTADTECTSLGTWSRETPHCLAQPCPLLARAPQHGRMNCSHPFSSFSYGSHCDVDCNEGFWLKGAPTVTCNNSGHWSQDLPTCQPVQCEAIRALSPSLSMNCSHPLGNFSFGSQCQFTCGDGFSLNGTEELFCSSTGLWNDSLPNCTEDMPVGSAMLLSTGVGAASVVLPLILIGLALLALLIFRRSKRKGKTIISDAPEWRNRENPVFLLET